MEQRQGDRGDNQHMKVIKAVRITSSTDNREDIICLNKVTLQYRLGGAKIESFERGMDKNKYVKLSIRFTGVGSSDDDVQMELIDNEGNTISVNYIHASYVITGKTYELGKLTDIVNFVYGITENKFIGYMLDKDSSAITSDDIDKLEQLSFHAVLGAIAKD